MGLFRARSLEGRAAFGLPLACRCSVRNDLGLANLQAQAMTSMNHISIAVLALVGLPLSPAVAVDELTLSGPYVFALTRDIEGCLKLLALEPHIAQCRTIPKGTRVNPKEPTRTNFILRSGIEDGREPRCLLIPAEILRATQRRIDGIRPVEFGVDVINWASPQLAGCTRKTRRDRGHRKGFPVHMQVSGDVLHRLNKAYGPMRKRHHRMPAGIRG